MNKFFESDVKTGRTFIDREFQVQDLDTGDYTFYMTTGEVMPGTITNESEILVFDADGNDINFPESGLIIESFEVKS